MPFAKVDMDEERLRFVLAAAAGKSGMSELCEQYGISRECGYRWLRRYREGGAAEVLVQRSRRPKNSPGQSSAQVAGAVTELRRQRPDWGASKLHYLLRKQYPELGSVSRSTVHRILLREGLVRECDRHRQALKRFEREKPNELWQMDFKGPKGFRQRSGPLSLMDDCSRYMPALKHLENGQCEAVRGCLRGAFEECGVPEAMLMDHGTPWWNANSPLGWTELSVWLMRQGVRLYFSGYGHPQTQGKIERMHRVLCAAGWKRRVNADEQSWLDEFRQEYNFLRPHEGLGGKTPASVWQPSGKAYREVPAPWEYRAGMEVLQLNQNGQMRWEGRRWDVSRALKHQVVALETNGEKALVHFCRTPILELNLREGTSAVMPVNPFRAVER